MERAELGPADEWTASFPGWCFLMVAEGRGYWLGATGAREINTGEAIALSPLREGCFRASQLGVAVLKYFRFDPDLVTGLLTPIEREKLAKAARNPRFWARWLPADNPAARQFAAVSPLTQASNALLLRCDLLSIVGRIFANELAQPMPANASYIFAQDRIKFLMNQLSETEFLRLSATELAAKCRCSPRHFNRYFYNCFGKPIRQKQQEARLLRARQMLEEGTSRIGRIAQEAGFKNLTRFHAAFRRQFGVSPDGWLDGRGKKAEAAKPAIIKAG